MGPAAAMGMELGPTPEMELGPAVGIEYGPVFGMESGLPSRVGSVWGLGGGIKWSPVVLSSW